MKKHQPVIVWYQRKIDFSSKLHFGSKPYTASIQGLLTLLQQSYTPEFNDQLYFGIDCTDRVAQALTLRMSK